MRAIDADALKDYIDAQEGRPFIGCTIGEALKIMTDEQPTIQPEPHWIPVTEGLPKKCNTTYLATVDYGEHGMAVGQRFFFGDNIGWNDKSVVAWMPLPEPYKGVTE